MDFIAIDIETANVDLSSICQIGLATYKDKELSDEWKTYVDPEDEFDPINISIHGIDEDTVKGAPTIRDIAEKITAKLACKTIISHTAFDRVALHQSFTKNRIQLPEYEWLDTARIARRTWEEFAWKGYGLQNICAFLGYKFGHHDALEDAKAAAQVLLAAMDKSGLNISDWVKRIRYPIGSQGDNAGITRIGNPEGPFHGDVLTFTGSLSMHRHQAADIASNLGFEVSDGVNKRTSILVVGDQDTRKLSGHDKSSKHRKAEMLINEGQSIKILRETDFMQMAKLININT